MSYFIHLKPGIKRITAVCALLVGLTAMGAESPRERLLMDFNWRFHLGDAADAGDQFAYTEVSDLTKTHVNEIGKGTKLIVDLPDPAASNLGSNVSFVEPDFDDDSWRKLDLPHDWVVELPFSTNADFKHGFKAIGKEFPENNIGWYRREFDLLAADKEKTLWVEFDGVYRNSLVWLNGHCLGRNVSGYDSFRYDISKFANFGGKNELVVRVDASRFEGWFYEGAGIYRHVWLEKTARIHTIPGSMFVATLQADERTAKVRVQTKTTNDFNWTSRVSLEIALLDPKGKIVAQVETKPELVGILKAPEYTQDFEVKNPQRWDLEHPVLYHARVSVFANSNKVAFDEVSVPFGIRTVAFDAEKGFLLNGERVEIKGTCNHQDHAGVGSAMPDALQYYRIKKLKEMGCNAIRTSHNPPTPELLEACDELGMLVMDETRRMDTTPQALEELTQLIERDRNHPSVFMWSLGNEEMYLQGTKTNNGFSPAEAHEAAVRVLTPMQDLAHQLDPTRLCTVAMNGGWGEGISTVIDVQGFNYHTANINKFRGKFPEKLTIGTEVASTRTTRGIYADDKEAGYVAAYGENGIEKAWAWWPYFAANPFTSGGFVWTGFDYRGEPTPYKWPCINSHFGLMDMCGFPKDLYYYYQAWWSDKPVLHLAPHWNWAGDEGKMKLVRCFSNCKEVELFLNGKNLGKQTMATNGYLDWNVAYAPGVLSAKGYKGRKVAEETKAETTGAATEIRLQPDRTIIHADGEDLSIVAVSVVDARGRLVPNAMDLVQFEISGPGKIIGVGNGDPSSHEADKAGERRVFCGLAQVIIEAGRQPGKIELKATSAKLKSGSLKIKTETSKSPGLAVP